MKQVVDLRGEIVREGDRIAYAATDGRSSGLRVGKVTEIVLAHQKFDAWDVDKDYPRDVPVKLRVSVELSTGYGVPTKAVLIEADFKRFVKVGM